MKLIWTALLGSTIFLWAAQTQVTYKETVATPKQSVVAIQILAEGMNALNNKAAKVEKKNGKIIVTLDEEEVAKINKVVGEISHSTTGKERKDNKEKYKTYIKYVNKVSKANHFIKGNRKKVSDVTSQVCVNLLLNGEPVYDIESKYLAEYRWDNEINGVDIWDQVSYNGDVNVAAQILSNNTDVFEDDEYFYVTNVRAENGKLLMDTYYVDDEESLTTVEVPKGKACVEKKEEE